MDWGLTAQMGLSIGSSLFGGSQESKAAEQQQEAANDAIKTYNKGVILKSAQDISALNVSKTISRMQTSQALFAVQRQGMEEKSQRRVMAAATDTAGASARQALQAVEVSRDQAKSMYRLNQELSENQIDMQIRNTVASAKNSLEQLKYGAGSAGVDKGIGNAISGFSNILINKLGE